VKKTEDMNDSQLVESCIQGETEEFGKIVEKYKGKVMSMAINILGNIEDAEDVCQDTFIRAYTNLENFDVQRSFSNWLYSILCNRCFDLLRKRKRFRLFLKKLDVSSAQYIEAQPSNSLGSLKLNQAILKELNPRERTVLFLWAHEGYTSEETAQVLKCSSSTARVHLFTARRKLKRSLEQKNVSMQSN